MNFHYGKTLLYVNPPSFLLLVKEGGTGQYGSEVIRTKGGRERQRDQINHVSIENKAKKNLLHFREPSWLRGI